MNNIVKAAEFARNCDEQRARSQYDRALTEARKALVIEPNLPAANLASPRSSKYSTVPSTASLRTIGAH